MSQERYDGTDPVSRSESANVSQMPVSQAAVSQDVPSQEAVDVVSSEEDDSSELNSEQKALLRYKNKVKKSFKSPKLLRRYAEQMAKVENTISKPKKIRPKEPALNTPSALMPVPSDFEHVFHAQEQLNKPQEETRDKEHKEQEILKRILQRITSANDPVIPIYVGDDSQPTKVLNIPLARLNELSKILGKDAINSVKKIQPMPAIKPLKRLTPISLPVRPAFPFKTEGSGLPKKEKSPLPKSSAAKSVPESKSGLAKFVQMSPGRKSIKSVATDPIKSLAAKKSSSQSSPNRERRVPKSSLGPKSLLGPKSSLGPKSVVRSSAPGRDDSLFKIRTKEVKRDNGA